jgi:hypothetical protein
MNPTAAVLVMLLAAPGPLREALDRYDFGEYGPACEQLEGLRAGGTLSPDDTVVALRYLGACHHFLGEKDRSRAAFDALLDADPGAELDPVQFPPELVAFFRDIRDHRAPPPPATVTTTAPERPRKSRGMAFLPFGVGQFQNDEPGKGALFASLEGVALGAGVVGLALFESQKKTGGFLQGGTFEDEQQASTLQTLYASGFMAFSALSAIGVVDAMIHFDEGAPGIAVMPAPGGFVLGGRF